MKNPVSIVKQEMPFYVATTAMAIDDACVECNTAKGHPRYLIPSGWQKKMKSLAIFMARDDIGNPQGYLELEMLTEHDKSELGVRSQACVKIGSIAVLPMFQNSGIATSLLEEAVIWMMDNKYQSWTWEADSRQGSLANAILHVVERTETVNVQALERKRDSSYVRFFTRLPDKIN